MGVDIRRRDTNIRESKEIVKADFDQVAYLALNEKFSRMIFIKMNSDVVKLCGWVRSTSI